VKVNIRYNPPAGIVGATIAQLFGEEPEQQLDDDLRRFKQVLEVGEVVVSEATLMGTGYFAQRPARPAAASELEAAEESDSLPSQTGTGYPLTEDRLTDERRPEGRRTEGRML
jgi:hypothetical protein